MVPGCGCSAMPVDLWIEASDHKKPGLLPGFLWVIRRIPTGWQNRQPNPEYPDPTGVLPYRTLPGQYDFLHGNLLVV